MISVLKTHSSGTGLFHARALGHDIHCLVTSEPRLMTIVTVTYNKEEKHSVMNMFVGWKAVRV
jgi:hypothetical protein